MSGTQLTPMQTFEEKVKAKLKDTIADMLPDEALAALVQKAIDEEFFKPTRRNVGNDYNPQWEDAPSWFTREVAKLAEPIIRECVKREFEQRKGDIEFAVKQFCSDQNLALLMTANMSSQMTTAIYEAAGQIVAQIKQGY